MQSAPLGTPALSYEDLFAQVLEVHELSEQRVFDLLGEQRAVDEVAVLFSSVPQFWEFMKLVVGSHGWALTNIAEDAVHTEPIQSFYRPEYWFFTKPDMPFRIEVMMMKEGHSPVHTSAVHAQDGRPVIVHASWKPPRRAGESWLGAYTAERVLLESKGCILAQSCESSYGLFSYYAPDTSTACYLKPRINTRDMEIGESL